LGDVYAGWADVRRALKAMGLTVLVNRAVKLEHNRAKFWLSGTRRIDRTRLVIRKPARWPAMTAIGQRFPHANRLRSGHFE
jgi:hypothetical protein